MYDPATSELIRSTPDLPDLDREGLPDRLARAFAEIVSAGYYFARVKMGKSFSRAQFDLHAGWRRPMKLW